LSYASLAATCNFKPFSTQVMEEDKTLAGSRFGSCYGSIAGL